MKKGFLDGYKTYNPETEGYGSSDDWNDSFRKRMGYQEAITLLGKQDPLSILNLPKNFTNQQLKSSYRKLAKEWHPDLNKSPDAEQMFKKIDAAYEILSRKVKN